MDTTKTIAALFDFDGVIMDTELQYTIFWNEQGEKYLHVKNFGPGIKGQTLTQIYDKHFAGELVSVREQITSDLNLFEKDMAYEYLPGVQDFLVELRRHNVKIALVTSSNDEKWKTSIGPIPNLKNNSTVFLPETCLSVPNRLPIVSCLEWRFLERFRKIVLFLKIPSTVCRPDALPVPR